MAGASSKRYARAAFELARESGDFDGWQRRLETVRTVLDHPGVRDLVRNPTTPVESRQQAVETLLGDAAGIEGVNLAKLLVASGRADQIDDIVDEFQRRSDEELGRVRATVIAAVELEEADTDRLRERLAARLGRTVLVQPRVDPRVLGGLVVRYGDHMIDASVAARLQQLRRVLVES